MFEIQVPKLNITLNQNIIVFVENYKHLGAVVGKRLTFEQHIDSIIRRVYGMLRKLHSLNICLPTCCQECRSTVDLRIFSQTYNAFGLKLLIIFLKHK